MAEPVVVAWHKRLNWKAWALPAVVVAVVLVVLLGKVVKTPSTKDISAEAAAAAQAGAAAAVQQQLGGLGTTDTTAPPAAQTPRYDYLECTHQRPGEMPPCSPVLVWPLTEGAKAFIGYESGGIPGELSTVQTRIVYDQVRALGTGINPCALWLGVAVDAGGNFNLTVYPTADKAPQGATKLVDCSPTGKGTDGTIPTQGT